MRSVGSSVGSSVAAVVHLFRKNFWGVSFPNLIEPENFKDLEPVLGTRLVRNSSVILNVKPMMRVLLLLQVPLASLLMFVSGKCPPSTGIRSYACMLYITTSRVSVRQIQYPQVSS